MNKVTKTDKSVARELLPKRSPLGNKGSFGKLLIISGSNEYRGASHLALESALRGGAGYVTLLSEATVTDSALQKFPETLLITVPPFSDMTDVDMQAILRTDKNNAATLIGPGCGKSKKLAVLTEALLTNSASPLIIDADAINSLAEFSDNALELIARAKREIVLTPHPLEFSRLSGIPMNVIEGEREEVARRLALATGATVLLKGYGTVITDGETIYLNTSGSSALAKAGSGDCLAGLLGALLAAGTPPLEASALAAYLHGAAGDALSSVYSDFGVTPSDLPKQIAKTINML